MRNSTVFKVFRLGDMIIVSFPERLGAGTFRFVVFNFMENLNREPIRQENPSNLEELSTSVSELMNRFRKWMMTGILVSLPMVSQGCMYSPRYEDAFRTSAILRPEEINARQTRVRHYLADPQQQNQTPALQSGIEPFQRERVMENFENLIHRVTTEDFDAYMRLCESAKTTLGIMNPDRYDPEFLKNMLENYLLPELHRDRPVILAIMSRKDREGFGGMQALNVETYRLRELTRAYKVLVVETSTVNEMLHHLTNLQGRGILRQGNLKGVIIGSHGDKGNIDAGLIVEDVHKLSRLNWYFSRNEPSYMVFASCQSGSGGMEGYDGFSNFANRAGLLFPKTNVVSCDGIMVGIDYETNTQGRLVENSIRLTRMSDVFGSNTTYQPRYDDLVRRGTEVYTRSMGNRISEAYVQFALRAGLINADDIVQAFSTGTDPSVYRIYMDCGYSREDIAHFRSRNVAASTVFEFFQMGIYTRQQVLTLVDEQVTPEQLRARLERRSPQTSGLSGYLMERK